ncbi:MAG: PilZ domain-containing protein [Planctomycetota bacterium]|nr:PilZ domain-containing protein [Planctomycetota bacterium]
MSQERRSAKRIPARGCRVDFSYRGKFYFSKFISYDNLMVDMSPGGLSFTHPEPLKIGMSMGLVIHPQNTFLPVQARGKVAWVEKAKKNGHQAEFSIGIEFRRIRKRDLKQIRQILDTLSGYFGVPRIKEKAKGRRMV